MMSQNLHIHVWIGDKEEVLCSCEEGGGVSSFLFSFFFSFLRDGGGGLIGCLIGIYFSFVRSFIL